MPPSCASPETEARFAPFILRAGIHFMPDLDPLLVLRLGEAQACAESGMNPNAVSGVGAKGLFQFMDPTFGDARRARKTQIGSASAFDPHAAAEAWGWYMGSLRAFWAAVPDLERHWFAVGSYNAGPGNIRSAFRLCGGNPRWSATAACLARVTGAANARQTTDYQRRIQQWSQP